MVRKKASEPRLLFRTSKTEWAVEKRHSSGKTGYVTDGPFFWRTDDGKLLCLWSSFSAEGYTQAVAVSDTGGIDSHFSQRKPLFMKNGGHGMLFKTKENQTMLALHQPNEHLKEHPVFLPLPLPLHL